MKWYIIIAITIILIWNLIRFKIELNNKIEESRIQYSIICQKALWMKERFTSISEYNPKTKELYIKCYNDKQKEAITWNGKDNLYSSTVKK